MIKAWFRGFKKSLFGGLICLMYISVPISFVNVVSTTGTEATEWLLRLIVSVAATVVLPWGWGELN